MEEKQGALEIYDSMGELLQKITLHNNSNEIKINTSLFKEGIYFYQILSKGKAKDSSKFSVMHE